MIHLFAVPAFCLYAAAAVFFVLAVLRARPAPGRIAGKSIRAAFLFSTLTILSLLAADRPFVLQGEAALFLWLAWLITFFYLIFGRRYLTVGMGASIAAAFLFAGSSALLHLGGAADSGRISALFVIFHVLPALAAELCLVAAGISSALFLYQENNFKRKNPDVLAICGPSLARLSAFRDRTTRMAFLFTSFAIVSGAAWALGRYDRIAAADLLMWLTVAAWLLLAAALVYPRCSKCSERTVAMLVLQLAALFFIAALAIGFRFGNTAHGKSYIPAAKLDAK